MTNQDMRRVEELLDSSGLTGDAISQHDPFWGQLIAHAECGADVISERGADLTLAQKAELAVYLVVRSIETLYNGEPFTDFPSHLEERVLAL